MDMRRIGNSFKHLILVLLVASSFFASASPEPIQSDQTATQKRISLYAKENPYKALQLIKSNALPDGTLPIEYKILEAKAYLALNALDYAAEIINLIPQQEISLDDDVFFSLIEVQVQYYTANQEFNNANNLINSSQKHSRTAKNKLLEAKFVNLKVEILKRQSLYNEAQVLLEKSIAKYEKDGDVSITSMLKHSLANLFYQTDQFALALQWYADALGEYKNQSDTLTQILLLKNLSLANRGLSQTEQAGLLLQEAQTLAIAIENPEELADICNLKGSLLYRSGSLTESLEYYNQSLILREEQELLYSTATTLVNIARVQRELGEFEEATDNLQKSIEIREGFNDQSSLASAYNEKGNLLSEQEKYADALMSYLTSLKIRQEAHLTEGIARSLTNIGLTYRKINSNDNALRYLEEAIKLIDQNSDLLSQAYIYIQYGNILREVNRPNEAIASYTKAHKLREKSGDKQAIAQSYKSLSYAYSDIQQFDRAKEHLTSALSILKELDDEMGVADIYNELGNIEQRKGNHSIAIEHFQSASILYTKNFDLTKRALCMRKIGESQTVLGQFHQAYSNLELALNLSKTIDNPTLQSLTYLAFYDYHSRRLEYKEALLYFKKYSQIKDSLSDFHRKEDIWKASLDLELNQKTEQIKHIEREMDALRTEAELKSIQIEKQKLVRNFIILGSMLVVIIAVVSLYGFILIRKKNKHLSFANNKLSQSEQELKTLVQTKDKLFSIISHDLRSPFTALIGLTEVLTSHELSPEKSEEIVHHLHKSSQKLLTLIENLLQWSRSQSGKIKLTPKQNNILEMVNDSLSIHQLQVQHKQLQIMVEIKPHDTLFADYDTISTVIRNLLSNSIKFTPEHGSILISSETNHKATTLTITDTGIGMSAEEVQKLFKIGESFTKPGTNQEVGTGLGLIVCKEFTEMNGGTIQVNSSPGMGTTFQLIFPNA